MCPLGAKSYALPFHLLHDTRSNIAQDLQPLEMTSVQTKFIANTMEEMKERASKRQKIGPVDRFEPKRAYADNESSHCLGNDGDGIVRDQFDILEELDAHPQVIHIVATPGGLITYWNEAFTKITKPSASLQKIPLTIFELVDSKELSSLYSMVALSLHNIGIANVENFVLGGKQEDTSSDVEVDPNNGGESRQPSHLSITLPCRAFRNSSVLYNITVVFMNDDSSVERCFLGILTPRARSGNTDDDSLSSHASYVSSGASSNLAEEPNSTAGASDDDMPLQLPCGKILRVDDDVLCHLLL